MDLISAGVLADIIEGAHPESPVVQILSMKRIPSGAQERWRLLVSDSLWSLSFAMLATQLNDLVASGTLSNNCLICLNRYVCNIIHDNKKVLILLDVTVVRGGNEVGGKIGEPTMYDASKPRSQQRTSRPTGQRAQAYGNRQPNFVAAGGSQAQRPNGPRQLMSSHNAVTPRAPNGNMSQPIASLTPYQARWTICVRITNKSNIRTYTNTRGEGKLFSMDLLDQSGEIRATAFNEQCDKYYDMIEVNKVYFITYANLKPANKQFTSLNNDYEMAFNRITEVMPCHENTDIPTMQFNFIPFDQLELLSKDSIVDIIGICKEAMELSSVTQRTSGREIKKRDIQLVDNSNKEVRMTLWGVQAEEFDGSLQPVIAMKGAKVSDFGGISLTTVSASCVTINPDIREAHMLKGWFENGGNVVETINLSAQKQGVYGVRNFKLFAEAQVDKLGSTKSEYYWACVCILLLKKENCLYTACPQTDCNKKVIDQNNGLFRCEKCNRDFDGFKWRLLIQACIADYTESQWVTFFQDEAERLIGTNTDDLAALRDNNGEEFQSLFEAPALQFYEVKLRCFTEMYNDKQSWKNSVVTAHPVNPREQNYRLISEIKDMVGLP